MIIYCVSMNLISISAHLLKRSRLQNTQKMGRYNMNLRLATLQGSFQFDGPQRARKVSSRATIHWIRREHKVEPLGSLRRPVIIKITSEQRSSRARQICEEYGFKYIIGLECDEDLTDLTKAIQQRNAPAVHDLCPERKKSTSFVVPKNRLNSISNK